MSFIVEQKIKGTIYLYKATSYRDKETKQPRQKRIFLGKRDPKTNEFIPAKNKTPKNCLDFGNFYFLDNISKQLKLYDILKQTFGEYYKEILTTSFFEVSEKKPLYLCENWIDTTEHYDSIQSLTSQRISDLLLFLGNSADKRINFSKLWAKKRMEKEYIAFDITSISSYSKLIEFVEYGYNRDKEKLPQINLGMLFGEKSLLPIYYTLYSGSIKDVSTLKNMITFSEYLEINKLIFIMDKGFYSNKNIMEMYKKNIKFAIAMPFTDKKSDNLIKTNGKEIIKISNAFKINQQIVYGIKQKIKIAGKNINAFVYFDEQKRIDKKEKLITYFEEFENHIRFKRYNKKTIILKCLDNHFKQIKDFYKIEEKNGIVKLTREEKKIDKYLTKEGYFIILSNQDMSKKEILTLYRKKDSVEKSFDNMKNELDLKRLRIHSDIRMEGRLFIGFISLILYSYISKIMRENDLFKKYTEEQLMRELKKIRLIQFDKNHKIVTELTKKQKDIFKYFNIPIPEML